MRVCFRSYMYVSVAFDDLRGGGCRGLVYCRVLFWDFNIHLQYMPRPWRG